MVVLTRYNSLYILSLYIIFDHLENSINLSKFDWSSKLSCHLAICFHRLGIAAISELYCIAVRSIWKISLSSLKLIICLSQTRSFRNHIPTFANFLYYSILSATLMCELNHNIWLIICWSELGSLKLNLAHALVTSCQKTVISMSSRMFRGKKKFKDNQII